MAKVLNVILLWTLLLLTVRALAQGSYTQLEFPGSAATLANGVNKRGDIVGQWSDGSKSHGFYLHGQTYKTIDYPGAEASYAMSLNDNGEIVGWAVGGTSYFGWMYDIHTGNFEQIVYPGATYTLAFGINNSGAIAGYFQIFQGKKVLTSGFEEVAGQYTMVDPPGSKGTQINGISAGGVLVGYAAKFFDPVNFSFHNNIYRRITIPDVLEPLVFGVNPSANAVVGTYILDGQSAGFVYQENNFQQLLFPGAINTYPRSINAFGVVVGAFESSTITDGFVWTPPVR